MENHITLISSLCLFLGFFAASVHGQVTRVGFYLSTCPNVESIVGSTVAKHVKLNPRVAPGLLRLHFHDCFVRGCDGSVLLDGAGTEKSAVQNSGIIGYNVIDEAKARLEALCPGVVSCADILALAARDSVVLTKGFGWKVPTGRKDGRVSIASEASTLPGPRETVSSQISKFSALGLNTQDLVALVGSHTIGTTSCALFRHRLYNFTTATPSGADPTIDPAFVPALRSLCPQAGDATRRVVLDNGSGSRFDASFFENLRLGRAVLESDQFLWADPATRPIVQRFLFGRGRQALNFNFEFGKSMVKMSNIGVKSGPADSEIRRICTAIN